MLLVLVLLVLVLLVLVLSRSLRQARRPLPGDVYQCFCGHSAGLGLLHRGPEQTAVAGKPALDRDRYVRTLRFAA